MCIQKNIFSIRIYIHDSNYKYCDIDVTVIEQRIIQRLPAGFIGKVFYLRINMVTINNRKISKQCMIRTNLLLPKDLPDYCVAVDCLVRVIKYDEKRVSDENERDTTYNSLLLVWRQTVARTVSKVY